MTTTLPDLLARVAPTVTLHDLLAQASPFCEGRIEPCTLYDQPGFTLYAPGPSGDLRGAETTLTHWDDAGVVVAFVQAECLRRGWVCMTATMNGLQQCHIFPDAHAFEACMEGERTQIGSAHHPTSPAHAALAAFVAACDATAVPERQDPD